MGAEEIVERILQLTQSLTRLQLDVVEYACLKVIVLMQPDLSNLKASSQVRSYHECVRELLMDYVAKSSPDINDKFNKLINRIPELHKTSQAARLMLVDLDLSAYLSSNSLLMELLRSDIQRYTPNHGNGNNNNNSSDSVTASATTTTTTAASLQGSATNLSGKTVSITLGSDSTDDDHKDPNLIQSPVVSDLLSMPNTTATTTNTNFMNNSNNNNNVTTITESRLSETINNRSK
ncbi:unnamed protein product [Trichobilharzia regenti]|nr:unnamed protein product [Trichobilharzia regenti]